MIRHLLVLLFVVFAMSTGYSQKNCGAMEVLDRQLEENPELFQNMEIIEDQIREFLKQNPQGTGQRYTVTIPTVVHVLYRTTSENISDAQIQSQIDVLNNDFSAANSDLNLVPTLFQPVVGNIEVQFCLAQRTPTGATTNGITRKSTTRTTWGTNDDVKRSTQGGTDAWDRNQYLNIWVCNIGGGILGYAQFPGGTAATDGVVLDYRYTGTIGTATAPFNKGRTATHEVGHWLNLRHIWGDATCGNDFVSDTPVHNTSNGGCPAYPHLSTCSGNPVEMTMNYMDYTDDACMYMFSQGQKARMRAVLEGTGARSSLQNSLGCVPPTPGACNAPTGLSSSNVGTTTATLSWSPVSGATSYGFEYKVSTATTWTVQNVTATSVNLTGLTAATTYNVRVRSVCGSTNSTYTTTLSFTTQTTSTCTDNYESNNSRNAAKVIPVGSPITAKISTSTDVDWFRFNNTSSQRRIRVTMTNLPADYDMRLYRNSSEVAISQNDGTNDEQIIFNTTTAVATYYVQVYGYNGAFNNNSCYNLLAEISGTNFREGKDEEEPSHFELVEDEFVVFPNPTSGDVTMMIPFGKYATGTLQIYDIAGKLVFSQQMEGDRTVKTFNMDVSSFQAGMYLINFTSGEKQYKQKLAIVRQ